MLFALFGPPSVGFANDNRLFTHFKQTQEFRTIEKIPNDSLQPQPQSVVVVAAVEEETVGG